MKDLRKNQLIALQPVLYGCLDDDLFSTLKKKSCFCAALGKLPTLVLPLGMDQRPFCTSFLLSEHAPTGCVLSCFSNN